MVDIQKLMQTRVRSFYEHRIDVGRRTNEELDEMVAWSRANVQGEWNYSAIYGTYFFFMESKDASMFALKWSR